MWISIHRSPILCWSSRYRSNTHPHYDHLGGRHSQHRGPHPHYDHLGLLPTTPQVLGVSPGSPLCPWCFGHSSWRSGRQDWRCIVQSLVFTGALLWVGTQGWHRLYIMFDAQFWICEHKLESPTPWYLSRDVQITTFTRILDVNCHLHCYILRTYFLCMGIFQCAWWEQIIHVGSPVECKHNAFVFIDEIFHITIDFLHGFIVMCGCIGMLELYLKNSQRVFSCTN